jgi:hypothetical protein
MPSKTKGQRDMPKINKLDRLSRLIKVSALIAAGVVDAGAVAAFRKAVLRYAGGTDQALKNLYQGENELGALVRKAFTAIDASNVLKELDDRERSSVTGAVYPRGDRWYLDEVADPDDIDEHEDDRDDDDDEDAADVEKGAHELTGKLLEHLKDALDHKRRRHGFEKKESDMDSLTKIIKDIGPIAVAKQIVAGERTFGISESEYVEAASRHAAALYGLPGDRAFAKLCETDGDVMRACGVLKAVEFELSPSSTTYPMPRDTKHAKADPSEGKAYNELMSKAEELRKTRPELSDAQAFERVYTARDNVELAKRERAESSPR